MQGRLLVGLGEAVLDLADEVVVAGLDSGLELLLEALDLLAIELDDLLELGLVAGSVDDGVDLLAGDHLGLLLGHPVGIALGLDARDVVGATLENPGLGAEGRAELVVVGDHHDATFEHLDGVGEGAEGLAVEVACSHQPCVHAVRWS